jgi:hypothetical protein
MTRTTTFRRSVVSLVAALGFSAAIIGEVPAYAVGVTRDQLEEQSWTCVPFAPANRWSCFNDGRGRPFPGNPEPAPSYTFLAFDMTTGEFVYTGRLVRGDLYRGQPCRGGEPYVYRALIDYYECV